MAHGVFHVSFVDLVWAKVGRLPSLIPRVLASSEIILLIWVSVMPENTHMAKTSSTEQDLMTVKAYL